MSLDMDMNDMQEKIPQLERITKNLGGGDVVVTHWALLFEFDDYSVYYETRPNNNVLEPRRIPSQEFDKTGEKTLLGTIKISPKVFFLFFVELL